MNIVVINNIEMKQCIVKKGNYCGEWKPLTEFAIRKDNGKYRGQCNECRQKIIKEWANNNMESIIKKREDNKEKNSLKHKEWYEKNKEYKKKKKKEWYEKNKEIIKIKKKIYNDAHKEEIRLYNKERRAQGKDKESIKKSNIKYKKSKRKNDPIWACQKDASRQVLAKLKSVGSSKKGNSSSKYFPWTRNELKQHIENQFLLPDNIINGIAWMTWQNRGDYNPETWDDNDPSTWTWQLDHIIPHSTFNYEIMDCQEFRDCWALSNLRPYPSKLNVTEGGSKIRHKE